MRQLKLALFSVLTLGVLAACQPVHPVDPAASSSATVSAGQETLARIHLVHLDTNGPNVDLLVDGEAVLTEIGPGSFSDLAEVVPGEHQIVLAPTGEGADAALTESQSMELLPDHQYTAALMGQATDNSLNDLLLIDESAALAEVDMATHGYRIIINNIAGSPPISFYEENEFLEKNLAYGDYSALAITPFSWDTGMIVAGEDLNNVVFPFDLDDDDSAGFWEPYVLYVYGLMGHYPGEPDVDYTFAMPYVQVLAPDIPAFLASFTPFKLTSDYQTYLSFEHFVAAWEKSGLGDTLQEGGPYTLFVPTDAAFDALDNLDALMADPAALHDLLLNHVAAGALSYDDMVAAGAVTTLQGSELAVGESQDDGVTFTLGDGVTVYNFPYTMPDGSLIYFVPTQVLVPAP